MESIFLLFTGKGGGPNKWGSLLAAVYQVEHFSEHTQWNEVEARIEISFSHFRIEKETGAETCPVIVFGIVT